MSKKFKIPMSKPEIGEEEKKAVINVFESGWFTQGKITEEFEASLSKYLSSNVAVVNNGSSALVCALLSHGIKPGDKIAVPAFTFIATASSAKILGIKVIPVDVDPFTFNMSIEKLEETVKKNKIKAVIVVDVAGLPVDIDAFNELAKRYQFILIEDAAEALGSEYKEKRIGSFNHTTIFSFHIAKPITTIEGGCISTKNIERFKNIKQLRDYGRSPDEKYIHQYIGSNFRITDLQSAIGLEQLKKIEKFVSRRSYIAKRYREELKNFNFQEVPSYVTRHANMLFFVVCKDEKHRNIIIKNGIKRGVDCRKSWLPIQKQPCFPELNKKTCKNAIDVFNKAITLPIYNSMNDEEIQYVIDTLN